MHAEIQVLEHFYANTLSFAGDDPFIACSKPACFCCLLYIRNHPGHFVEPVSHHKIYLNWRPPDVNAEHDLLSHEHQRDILNAMIQEIRKEALRQINERSAPRARHPDSFTGITKSTVHEQGQEALEEAKEIVASTGDIVFVNKGSHMSDGTSQTTALPF
jgi:TPP-dependent 2-oxoacid decarboxylase